MKIIQYRKWVVGAELENCFNQDVHFLEAIRPKLVKKNCPNEFRMNEFLSKCSFWKVYGLHTNCRSNRKIDNSLALFIKHVAYFCWLRKEAR